MWVIYKQAYSTWEQITISIAIQFQIFLTKWQKSIKEKIEIRKHLFHSLNKTWEFEVIIQICWAESDRAEWEGSETEQKVRILSVHWVKEFEIMWEIQTRRFKALTYKNLFLGYRFLPLIKSFKIMVLVHLIKKKWQFFSKFKKS